jgi:hypothetical protein
MGVRADVTRTVGGGGTHGRANEGRKKRILPQGALALESRDPVKKSLLVSGWAFLLGCTNGLP